MTDLPVTKAPDDLEHRAIEHLTKYGMSGVGALMLVAFTKQETEALRSQLAAAELAYAHSEQDLSKAQHQLRAAEAQLQAMRKALEEADGCFQAAYAEGLLERLTEADQSSPITLASLFLRRVVFAHHAIQEALRSLTEGKTDA